jgi:ribonuclease HI
MIMLFTDGACSGNPGPGGWASILRDDSTGTEVELVGGLPNTTNNQMELQAVIAGLRHLETRSEITVLTDSTYVAKGSVEWMPNWKANGWKRKERNKLKPVKNEALWKQLDELITFHNVKFEIVKGHSGHPENERCDQLAVEQSQRFQSIKN